MCIERPTKSLELRLHVMLENGLARCKLNFDALFDINVKSPTTISNFLPPSLDFRVDCCPIHRNHVLWKALRPEGMKAVLRLLLLVGKYSLTSFCRATLGPPPSNLLLQPTSSISNSSRFRLAQRHLQITSSTTSSARFQPLLEQMAMF